MKNHESVNQFLYDPSRTEQPVRLTAERTIPAQVFSTVYFFFVYLLLPSPPHAGINHLTHTHTHEGAFKYAI